MRITILICLLVINIIQAQWARNDWQKDRLLGKAKSVQTTEFDAIKKKGKIEKGTPNVESISTLKKYNTLGYIIESKVYNYLGHLTDNIQYRYNEQHRLIEVTDYGMNPPIRTTIKYDEKGNTTEISYLDIEDKVIAQSLFLYDDKGNKIEHQEYGKNHQLLLRTIYLYTENNLVEEYRYNADGHRIKYKRYEHQSTKENTEPPVNDTPAEKEIRDEEDNLIYKYTYQYNDRGDVIQSIRYSNNNVEVSTYRYQYDSEGNWIEKIQYSGKKPLYITERKIEYYH